jgi:hypothetical protein
MPTPVTAPTAAPTAAPFAAPSTFLSPAFNDVGAITASESIAAIAMALWVVHVICELLLKVLIFMERLARMLIEYTKAAIPRITP